MLGNVWEWCEDGWHNTYADSPADGTARPPSDGAAYRVIRGGSWDVNAWYVRAAYRNRYDPSYRLDDIGFRCARVQSDSGRA